MDFLGLYGFYRVIWILSGDLDFLGSCNSGETPRQFPNGAHIKVTSYDTLRNQLAAILIFIDLFITKIYSVIDIIFYILQFYSPL